VCTSHAWGRGREAFPQTAWFSNLQKCLSKHIYLFVMLLVRSLSPTLPSGIHEVCVWVYMVGQVQFTMKEKASWEYVNYVAALPCSASPSVDASRLQAKLYLLAVPCCFLHLCSYLHSLQRVWTVFNFLNIIVFMLCFLILFLPWCKVLMLKRMLHIVIIVF
jgi:hypothetical protein